MGVRSPHTPPGTPPWAKQQGPGKRVDARNARTAANSQEQRLRAMEEPARKKCLYKMEFSELKKLAEEMSISIRNTKKSGSRKNKRPEGSKGKNELVDDINSVIIARLVERPMRPSEQALASRRLMNRPKSHIVVLEALLEEINRLT